MRYFLCFVFLFWGWMDDALRAQVTVLDAQVNRLAVNPDILTGAQQPKLYVDALAGKRIGVVANHTSLIDGVHLVDFLQSKGINVVAVFAPEHGFRGEAGAGDPIADGKDATTGLPVRSLYGKTKKPTPEMLADVDLLLFDMQDVGARFYTYLSTLHYIMEAGAEQNIPVMVLDRPNPNGFYVDGPVLDPKFSSFVGMHPIAMVHGMTLGELARMINTEGWLKNGVKCTLSVIPCANYKHSDLYNLPVNPSPNLGSMEAVYLYPSLCLFEPTSVSIGRGTTHPFECIGHPDLKFRSFSFTPKSIPGRASSPKHEGKTCYGVNLKEFGGFYFTANQRLYLDWLVESYKELEALKPGSFFTNPEFFDKLAGTDRLRKQLVAGATADEIRSSWEAELTQFKALRKKYLLYP